MKKSIFLLTGAIFLFTIAGYGQSNSKVTSTKSHIKFFSTTPAEDLEAHNTAAISTLNKSTGEVVFSVPMQSFEFEKALMQKHFNNDKFLDTKKFPKSKLKGKIINIEDIDFTKDGTYDATVEGNLTIKGVTKPLKEQVSITVKGDKLITKGQFNITLADHNITFVKGKPSSNIAKIVEVTVHAEY